MTALEPAGMAVDPRKRDVLLASLAAGMTMSAAIRQSGMGRATAYKLKKLLEETGEMPAVVKRGPPPATGSRPAPKKPRKEVLRSLEEVLADQAFHDPLDAFGPRRHLSTNAKRALEDFGYFRSRYLGRGPSPWQVEAAEQMVPLLESPDKEFVVVNCPPGVGKSSLFTHDLPVWLIARNRRIRILIGSHGERQAGFYVNRMRDTLSRTVVAEPPREQVERGLATIPQATLVEDFGRFKGEGGLLWTWKQFIVAQELHLATTEKEATAASFGMDTKFLGLRFELIVWDDLVDTSTVGTPYAREKLISWWDLEAETRLDQGGLFVLQGQRINANDLYRYALDQKAYDDDGNTRVKYRHIVYPAHFEDRCEGKHKAAEAQPYPLGCLLDPFRLPWRDLLPLEQSKPEQYRITYQQQDGDPRDALVPRIWVEGGTDQRTNEVYVGCWDRGRELGQIPPALTAPVHSVVTVDPSPSRYWALQWWLYEPTTERRYLIDLVRTTMTAPSFLDWRHADSAFVGLMEEWHQRSVELGHPIKYWIVEANAAQKFMLQYDHAKRWQLARGTSIIPHQTQGAIRRPDEEMGVTAVAPHYRYGRYRLPMGEGPLSPAHTASMKLVNEVVGFPTYATDDCHMAQWFLEFNIPRLFPKVGGPVTQRRPSWSGTSRRRPLR